ncbi:MAG: hypothetical protein KatS3mg061_3323 [Dehalococcoidia bacterium]|nr:MAG: hypothetical protein KatS3mg061_3323 [Dehalococcoidia bacterium]
MLDQVRAIAAEAHRHLAQATTEQELELWRTRFLGRKGALKRAAARAGDAPRRTSDRWSAPRPIG